MSADKPVDVTPYGVLSTIERLDKELAHSEDMPDHFQNFLRLGPVREAREVLVWAADEILQLRDLLEQAQETIRRRDREIAVLDIELEHYSEWMTDLLAEVEGLEAELAAAEGE